MTTAQQERIAKLLNGDWRGYLDMVPDDWDEKILDAMRPRVPTDPGKHWRSWL